MGFLHSHCISPPNVFKTVFHEGTNYLKTMSAECRVGRGRGRAARLPQHIPAEPVPATRALTLRVKPVS